MWQGEDVLSVHVVEGFLRVHVVPCDRSHGGPSYQQTVKVENITFLQTTHAGGNKIEKIEATCA